MSKVIAISDTHFPFHCPKAYKKLVALIKKEKPSHVVQVGDLLDQYVFSKYSRSLSIIPKDEIEKGLDLAETMWDEIKLASPGAKCFQLLGNHDMRMSKRISDRLPELSEFFDHSNLYKFPGVTTFRSDRDFLEIDGVVYVHGWLSKSIDHARYFGKPVVHGHTHRGGLSFDGRRLWSLDTGFMADINQLPLQYGPSRWTKCVVGAGKIDSAKPQFIFLDD